MQTSPGPNFVTHGNVHENALKPWHYAGKDDHRKKTATVQDILNTLILSLTQPSSYKLQMSWKARIIIFFALFSQVFLKEELRR